MPITIPKAIEILTGVQYPPDDPNTPDAKDAVKLGIEALKVIRWNRTHKHPSNALLLPGEARGDSDAY